MIGKLKDLLRLAGGEWVVSFTTRSDPRELFDSLKDSEVSVEVKKSSQPRSKSANDFMWAMCTDIGKALRPPVPKDEIYRKAIRDVGEYEPLPIKAEAVETFQERWASKGTGWFADVVDDSKLKGYKLVFAYYGSSTYTADEMSRVLDYLRQDMESMGLPIPLSKDEEARIMERWQSKAKVSCNKATRDVSCAAG
jgi:hypothetical protein